jgi:hypothetical protein
VVQKGVLVYSVIFPKKGVNEEPFQKQLKIPLLGRPAQLSPKKTSQASE